MTRIDDSDGQSALSGALRLVRVASSEASESLRPSHRGRQGPRSGAAAGPRPPWAAGPRPPWAAALPRASAEAMGRDWPTPSTFLCESVSYLLQAPRSHEKIRTREDALFAALERPAAAPCAPPPLSPEADVRAEHSQPPRPPPPAPPQRHPSRAVRPPSPWPSRLPSVRAAVCPGRRLSGPPSS